MQRHHRPRTRNFSTPLPLIGNEDFVELRARKPQEPISLMLPESPDDDEDDEFESGTSIEIFNSQKPTAPPPEAAEVAAELSKDWRYRC